MLNTMFFRCYQKCKSLGKAYYAPIWGDQCSCGNHEPKSRYKKAEGYCNKPCPGNPSLKCGGVSPSNRVNVYKIQTGTTTASTTSTTTVLTITSTLPATTTTPSGKLNWI